MADVFITDDFLLQNPAAIRLYHEYAEPLPILDFHCHLPPRQIAEDHRFANLAEIWLHGDHYKWRAMRANGVPERFCTGDASDWEKFLAWAQTVPKTLGNPLYHWTHLELNRPFGIRDRLLGPHTAQEIWDRCNALLASEGFSCRGILRRMGVAVVCTTDDPTDDLAWHAALAADPDFSIRVFPTFRPDRAIAVESVDQFNAWVDRLGESAGSDIRDYSGLLEALKRRHDFFHAHGCRLSDHGVDTMVAEDYVESEVQAAFAKLRVGRELAGEERAKFKSAVLHELALMDWAKGWTQQFHIGAMRNTNTRMFQALGPDAGFDSIGDLPVARPLAKFLDRLDRDGRLAKTILYNLNPAHNEVFATMIGNFQDGTTPGKMQWGSAWWFLDQKDGMERHLRTLANHGLLSRFVGMVTDSRSFLSYTRHEYFRRILCNLLGTEMEQGLAPRDFAMIGEIVQDICYRNAAEYFGFPQRPAQP